MRNQASKGDPGRSGDICLWTAWPRMSVQRRNPNGNGGGMITDPAALRFHGSDAIGRDRQRIYVEPSVPTLLSDFLTPAAITPLRRLRKRADRRESAARDCLSLVSFVPHNWPRRRSEVQETWSEWQDLNLRPPRPERGALPTCERGVGRPNLPIICP